MTRLERRERRVIGLVQHEVGRRNGRAVRVVRRVAERGVHARFEVFAQHVLQALGLGVDAVPRHAQRFVQVRFHEPVMADRLDGHAPARRRERHALVRAVLHEPAFRELFEHPRHRSAGHAEPRGERARGHGLAGAAQVVDRFEVVLYRLCVHGQK